MQYDPIDDQEVEDFLRRYILDYMTEQGYDVAAFKDADEVIDELLDRDPGYVKDLTDRIRRALASLDVH